MKLDGTLDFPPKGSTQQSQPTAAQAGQDPSAQHGRWGRWWSQPGSKP